MLIPVCVSSSPAFRMMYSTYKLNKQDDNIQPWCTPFPIWNQSVVSCPVLTCFLTCIQISQEAGKVVWYSHLFKNFPQFVVIHTVKGFGIVNKAEIDVFLELSCFFDDPEVVGNLISGSPAFSKSSLNICKFSVHIMLKTCLENFKHYFTSMWDECNCAVVWVFFIIVFLELEWKLIFSSPVVTAEFSNFAGILSATLSQHCLSGFEIAPLEFHHLH